MSLKIKPPDYKFCPFCGRKLTFRLEEGKKRKYCQACKWTYYPHVRCSAAGVASEAGKILLVKRKRQPYRGTWMFPGGFVDYGEHPKETVVREIKGETGLEVRAIELINVLQYKSIFSSRGGIVFFYRVEVVEGKLVCNDEENEEVAWKRIESPPKIGIEAHRYVIKKLQGGLYEQKK